MNTLIIFAKNPEPGKVKTRLAKDVGDRAAAEIYKRMLTHIVKSHEKKDYSTIIYGFGDILSLSKLLGRTIKEQQGTHLGKRMYNAIKSEKGKTVLIGSDIPELNEEVVNMAFSELEDSDIVLGPTFDGGYYLVGMKEKHDIFGDVQWSTPQVLEQTLKNCLMKGLSVKLLKKLRDVDTLEDIRMLEAQLEQ